MFVRMTKYKDLSTGNNRFIRAGVGIGFCIVKIFGNHSRWKCWFESRIILYTFLLEQLYFFRPRWGFSVNICQHNICSTQETRRLKLTMNTVRSHEGIVSAEVWLFRELRYQLSMVCVLPIIIFIFFRLSFFITSMSRQRRHKDI